MNIISKTDKSERTITMTINQNDFALLQYGLGFITTNARMHEEDRKRASEIEQQMFEAYRKMIE